MDELIEMSFGMWTRVGPRKHALDVVHNLATTTEPSMCDGPAASCQTTLTTCFTIFLVVVCCCHSTVLVNEARLIGGPSSVSLIGDSKQLVMGHTG